MLTIHFIQEILTKTTSNKFKMTRRPYGEPYPRREQDWKKFCDSVKLRKSGFPFEIRMT